MPRPMGEAKIMSETPAKTTEPEEETTALGTLGWVGAVVLCATAALFVLAWLGPLGER